MKINIRKPAFLKKKNGDENPHPGRLKHALFIVLAVVLVLSAVYIAAKTVGNVAVSNITDSFRKVFMSSSNGGWPLTVESLSIKEIKPVDGEILVLYNDEAQFLTGGARTMGDVQLNASDSSTAVRNGRILAYDIAK